MHPMIFVNLPVADIDQSRKFFAGLGYSFNENFSNDSCVTLVLGANQFAMLTQRDVFDSLHPAVTADASKTKECVVCLGVDNRECVDKLVDGALAAGATAGDTDDEDFMYGRSYHDLDGHSWQIFSMTPVAVGASQARG